MEKSALRFRDRAFAIGIFAAIVFASATLMLRCTSPEFSWDEADYLASANLDWRSLWGGSDYNRHNHGPMGVYLAKLADDILPASAGPLEVRLRFLIALAGSLSIGGLFLVLIYVIKTSNCAAIVGSGLLLLSVIRLEETNIIGPHHLMLISTLGVAALGCGWRDAATPRAAVGLGLAMAVGALSMTYVIPVVLCWGVAVVVAGTGWIDWDRKHIKVAPAIPALLVLSAAVVVVAWPPGILGRVILYDFNAYRRYPSHPTLVGGRIFEVTPRWAVLYWAVRLEAPLLFASIVVFGLVVRESVRGGEFGSQFKYLMIFILMTSSVAFVAHIAGARNLLQAIGVLSLAVGASFDKAFGRGGQRPRLYAAAILLLSVLNLVLISNSPSYMPYLATDGYRAFVSEGRRHVPDNSRMIVYGLPTLKLYAERSGAPLAFDATEMAWTTRDEAPIPGDVKYVLIPGFVWEHMPPQHSMRREVAEHWKVVWSFKSRRAWELRLYERP